MTGPKQEAQAALFYEFSIEGHVPHNHLVRLIDRFVDLNSVRAHLADFRAANQYVNTENRAEYGVWPGVWPGV